MKWNKTLLAAVGLLLAPLTHGQLGLEQIMADPDWIGPPVEQAWWSLDSSRVYYRIKENGNEQREIHQIILESTVDQRLAFHQQSEIDGPQPQFDAYRQLAVFVRDGDVFVREQGSGKLQQITRTAASESAPRFSSGADQVHYRRNGQWYVYDLVDSLETQLTDVRFSKDPSAEPEDELAQMQLRLFETLRDEQHEARLRRERQLEREREDPRAPAAPWYLGDEWQAAGSEPSPDGRWLLLAVHKAGNHDGREGKMPRYVTTSGYVDIEDVRTRVGRKPPQPQQLWLLDLQLRQKHEISFAALPGINDTPLAFLENGDDKQREDKKGKNAKAKPREITVENVKWHPEGGIAAVQLRAIDNKDRWLVTVDAEQARLTPRHRLHDDTWINWLFNDFGWMPEGKRLWFLSEESGYSHLYLQQIEDEIFDIKAGKPRPLTRGEFEVMDPVISPDGHEILVLSNRSHPTEYDLYAISVKSGEMKRLTELRGVEDFSLSPQLDQILVRWSAPYTPAQISLLNRASGELRPLTDTRTDTYKAIRWQQPEFIAVPSQHDAGAPIWSKFYPPQGEFNGKRPIVMFVHGAGYTQNTHHKFPYYFREQMFHNLLSQQGYLVLDMDFRASRGYGRDWRGAIYRRMGHPELEDLIDGVQWLVEEHNGDIDRVGVYGGSYGGFMSLMAMFRAPEIFRAGAALRPVTDWAHYNHGYTSNILNTPQQDPEAYRISSPIEYADQLQGHLLIAHGMLDDNVFYQDSVRLAQRLIELGKENWELASYPVEPHSFVQASSWLDEYRRILRLFNTTIGDQARQPAQQ